MTTPDPMDDELVRLYRQASAQDPRRPAPRVDAAIRAHARMVAAAGQGVLADAGSDKSAAAPANNAQGWRAMLASVAVVGLMGLLFLQFDRGTPQERDLVQGTAQPAESVTGRAAPRPQAERSGAPPSDDVVAAADTNVADAVPAPIPTPAPAPAPEPATPAPAPAQVAKSSIASMTGEGQSVPGESVAPRAHLSQAAAPMAQAPMAMAREREASPQAGAAQADTQPELRMKSTVPAPSVRREAAGPSALTASPPSTVVGRIRLARTGALRPVGQTGCTTGLRRDHRYT